MADTAPHRAVPAGASYQLRLWSPRTGRVGIELVDVASKLTHLVSPDEMATGQKRGDYLALCGDRFVAACLVEPGHGPCQRCREQAA